MCDCINEMTKKLEEKLPEMLKEKDSGFVKIESFNLRDYCFSFSNKFVPPFMLKYEVKFERKAKTGRVTSKTMPVDIKPSHCPLCGEKFPES